MRKIIYTRRTMAGVFALVCAVYLAYAVAHKPRILVLHSYATDFVWVRSVSEGVRSVLDEGHYEVQWHYMDTKRHPDRAFHVRAGRNARNMIAAWKPRVVLAIDDHAQEFVASCYASSPSVTGSACPEGADTLDDPPFIVYSGVNGEPADYGYEGAANVTGILQRLPLGLIKTAVVETFRRDCDAGEDCRLEVLYLRDTSTTSDWREREIMAAPWGPELRLTSRAVEYLSEWQQEVIEAPGKFDLLFFSDYRKLKLADGRGLADGDAVIDWSTACSELPTIGLGSSYGRAGEPLGFSVSPFEQGASAARMALDRLHGLETQPPRVSEGFVVYIRQGADELYPIPEFYKAFARSTETYFESARPKEACRPEVRELPPVFSD